MRAIWTGAIGFGLVNIPIRIFSAIESSTLDLDMLDKKNFGNIRYMRVNAATGREVQWENIVKGYKYDDEYVILTDDDFKKASPEKSKIIVIEEFVKEELIDSMYFDTPYYLEPAKNGEKAYALLHKALLETGKVALGTFVMRTKENFCMLKAAHDNIITLVTMRFAEEIRPTDELNIPSASTVKPAELKMAIALINQLSPRKPDLTKYHDTYTESLMKIIKAKAKGKRIAPPKLRISRSGAKDIMTQLKESLNKKVS